MGTNFGQNVTRDIASRHWLRMPVADQPGGTGFEFSNFTGNAIFDSQLKGLGQSWNEIVRPTQPRIIATYNEVISPQSIIHAKYWTVTAHISSLSDDDTARNAGWSVNDFRLSLYSSSDPILVMPGGNLEIELSVALRDIDASIFRISFSVAIYGKVVAMPQTPPGLPPN